jgi:O-antigen/teichoic acid export membrane protein
VLKDLLKDSVFYGGFLLLSKLIAFFTLPIITAAFTPAEFKIIDGFIVMLNFIVPFLFVGSDTALARYFNDADYERKELVSTAFFYGLGFTLIVLSLLLIFHKTFSTAYFGDSLDSNMLLFVFLNIPFIFINSFCIGVFKYEFKRIAYVAVAMFNPLLFALSVIGMGKWFELSLWSYFAAFLVFNALFALLALWLIRNHLRLLFKMPIFQKLFAFGLPFSMVSLVGVAFSFTERYLMNNYFLASFAGLYAFSYRIISLVTLANRAFQLSWGPFSMARYKDKNSGEQFRTLLTCMSLFLMVIEGGICLFSTQIILLVSNKSYLGSAQFLPFLLGANAFLILSSISNIGINITSKTILHLKNYLMALVVFVGTFFLLRQHFEELSLAISLFIAYSLLFIFQTRSSNKVYEAVRFPIAFPVTLVVSSTLFIYYLNL